jgi:hypothetical protein
MLIAILTEYVLVQISTHDVKPQGNGGRFFTMCNLHVCMHKGDMLIGWLVGCVLCAFAVKQRSQAQ